MTALPAGMVRPAESTGGFDVRRVLGEDVALGIALLEDPAVGIAEVEGAEIGAGDGSLDGGREQDGEELVVHREPVHGRGIHGEAGEQILARAGRNPESGGGLEGGDGDGMELVREEAGAGEVVGPGLVVAVDDERRGAANAELVGRATRHRWRRNW